MMEEEMQLARESDFECLTVIPSPNPRSGQEIVDYLDKNGLTIVDISFLKERKQFEVQLKEFKEKEKKLECQVKEFDEKEKQWAKERVELKGEVQRLQFRKDFWSGYIDKLLECIRKIAETTEFRRLKQFPMKEDAKFEFIREELLHRLSDHVVERFAEMKKMKKEEVPVCDEKLMESKPEVMMMVECSPKLAPVSASTMPMTSCSSLEKPSENIVKNLLPSAPSDDQAPKPVVPKLIIKITGQDKQSSVSVKPQRKHSLSESSTATLSSWKSEKPKKKKAKKSASHTTDEKPQPSPMIKVVNAINRKLKSAAFPLPLPAELSLPKAGSSKASSALSLSARSKGSNTKCRCDKCSNRFNSNRDYKDHRNVIELFLAETKDHNQSLPVVLQKKLTKFVSPPSPVPAPILGSSTTIELADESDEDMPAEAGTPFPQIPEAKSSDANAGSVNCSCHVCGVIFRTMAAVNFHFKKKHPEKGGSAE